jgi:3-oxoacyl-[acyl-carrier-protein] synthase II
MNRRIAVTGIGVVSALGVGRESFAKSLFAGRSGIDVISSFDPSRHSVRLAGEVKNFSPRQYIAPKTLRRMDRLSQMVVASTCMALEDAGIQVDESNRDRIGIILGTCFGGTDVAAQFGKVIFADSPRHANPILVPNTVMNAPAGHAAVELGVRGVNATVNHRETSCEEALAYGADTVARGRADVILAGGGDVISEFCFEVLNHFRLLSPLNGGPEKLRPFDRSRNGTVVGEGVGVLCLEDMAKALERGAMIYCEIAGWGMSGAPAPAVGWPKDSAGPVLALRRALASAQVSSDQIDAVSAAADGGPRLDQLEVEALETVFGEGGQGPRVTAVKGAMGENFASGGVRAVAMALAMHHKQLPPILGLEDPMSALNFVRSPLEIEKLDYGLVNGIASGGTFAALVMRRATGY